MSVNPLLGLLGLLFTASVGGGFAAMRVDWMPLRAARFCFIVAAVAFGLLGVVSAELMLPSSPWRYAVTGIGGALACMALTWLWSTISAREAASVSPTPAASQP